MEWYIGLDVHAASCTLAVHTGCHFDQDDAIGSGAPASRKSGRRMGLVPTYKKWRRVPRPPL